MHDLSCTIRSVPNLLARIAVTAAALLLSSCALLVNGLTQTVPVTSVPTGATVLVDGEPRGVTPIDLELRRDSTSVVTVRLGTREESAVVTPRANGTLIAVAAAPSALLAAGTIATCTSGDHNSDIFCVFLAGGTLLATAPMVVDGASGAWNELSPAAIHVEFD